MACATYTDEHLNYWCDVYINERLLDRFIKLETFLDHPNEILQAINDQDFRPLLPEQVKIAAKIRHDEFIANLQKEQEDRLDQKNAVSRNGVFVEPLHHHRYPRKKPFFSHG